MWWAFTLIRLIGPWCSAVMKRVSARPSNAPGLVCLWARDSIRTQTHDYYRHGTVILFAALYYLSGKVFAHTAPRHRHQEWLAFLRKIDQQIAPEFELHIICDNYSTHKHAKVTGWLEASPPFSHPFHSDLFLLAQSGGALLW